MKPACASLIGLAALLGGCSLDAGLDIWASDDIHLLSVEEARELRVYHTTFADEPYWSSTGNGPAPSRKRVHADVGSRSSSRNVAAWRAPRALSAEAESPSPSPATAPQPMPSANPVPSAKPVPAAELSCMTGDAVCEQRLSALVADPTRVWVFAPPTPADYVSGVRLLAFHRLRESITCTELRFGIQEAAATRDHLAVPRASPVVEASGKAKVQFVADLAAVIQKDMAATLAVKCPVAPRPAGN